MRLAHLPVPSPTHYSHVSPLQSRLVNALLRSKSHPQEFPSPPDPTILTTSFFPVYTTGRREIGLTTAEQQEYLRSGPGRPGDQKADFVEALRGGQTTFHGPGQLIAYPIIDLKRHGLTPRCYVRLLESSLIAALARYGIKGFTTDNPGVWTSPGKKIAAVGVHLRRNVTSHGIGLNVTTDLRWFDRIVACGLKGKGATSMEAEGISDDKHLVVEEVGRVFVDEIMKGLDGVEEVYRLYGEDVPD